MCGGINTCQWIGHRVHIVKKFINKEVLLYYRFASEKIFHMNKLLIDELYILLKCAIDSLFISLVFFGVRKFYEGTTQQLLNLSPKSAGLLYMQQKLKVGSSA